MLCSLEPGAVAAVLPQTDERIEGLALACLRMTSQESEMCCAVQSEEEQAAEVTDQLNWKWGQCPSAGRMLLGGSWMMWK